MWKKRSILNSLFSFQSRSIIIGRASTLGTKYFLEQRKIPLIHTLKKSNLYIHPLIISSPLHPETNKENMNDLITGAILNESYNCFHVYSREKTNQIWYTTCVTDLIEQGIDREGLVTIANLGKISNKNELMNVLDEAWTVTDQEFIDIVTLEVWKVFVFLLLIHSFLN